MEVGQIIVTENNGGRAEVKQLGEVRPGLFGLEFQVVTLVALDDHQESWGIRMGQECTVLKRVELHPDSIQACTAALWPHTGSDRPGEKL